MHSKLASPLVHILILTFCKRHRKEEEISYHICFLGFDYMIHVVLHTLTCTHTNIFHEYILLESIFFMSLYIVRIYATLLLSFSGVMIPFHLYFYIVPMLLSTLQVLFRLGSNACQCVLICTTHVCIWHSCCNVYLIFIHTSSIQYYW